MEKVRIHELLGGRPTELSQVVVERASGPKQIGRPETSFRFIIIHCWSVGGLQTTIKERIIIAHIPNRMD